MNFTEHQKFWKFNPRVKYMGFYEIHAQKK